jgi:hypothetical protein
MHLASKARRLLRKTGFDIIRARRPGEHNSVSRSEIDNAARPPGEYNADGLRSLHNHDFEKDDRFQQAYRLGLERTKGSQGVPGPWRIHIAIWAAQNGLRRVGDFVECGIYLGFTSMVMMSYLDWNAVAGDRKFYLIDNFEGLVPALLLDEEKALGRAAQYGKNYQGTYRRAKENLEAFRNTVIVRGSVPEILGSVTPKQVAYLHLDMNSAVPEVEAIRYFWPRITTGGVVLLDDFAFVGYEPQNKAINNLGMELGFSAAHLPTGQGIIIK